jgi:hypothetical protein
MFSHNLWLITIATQCNRVMTSKQMIVLGLIWFVAVTLWLLFGPREFLYLWQAKGAKRTAVIAGIYIFGILYQIFMIGWLVPLALGTYRLIRLR